jgi:hypothetical protein
VFDRPAAGRAFLEGLIRDHLDLGRSDQVSLVFGPKVQLAGPHHTPGIGQDMRSFIVSQPRKYR